MRPFACTSVMSLLVLSAGLSAAPVTFFGMDPGLGEATPLASWPNAAAAENAFLAMLVGVGTETFEGFAVGTVAPLALTFPGAGTATLTGPGSIASVPAGFTNGAGRYGISPTKYWQTGDVGFLITMSQPVAAFGFYGVDIGDFGGNLVVTVGGTPYALSTAGSPGGSVMFWGIIDASAPFTTVSFGNTAFGTDFFAFDNMTIGSVEQVRGVIPEPGTISLLAGGLALLAFRLRKRR